MLDGHENWLQGQDSNLRFRGYEPRGMAASLPCGKKGDRSTVRSVHSGRAALQLVATSGAQSRSTRRSLSGLLCNGCEGLKRDARNPSRLRTSNHSVPVSSRNRTAPPHCLGGHVAHANVIRESG